MGNANHASRDGTVRMEGVKDKAMRKTVSRARIYRRMGLLAERMDSIEQTLRKSNAVQRYWAALAWTGWFAFVAASLTWTVWK